MEPEFRFLDRTFVEFLWKDVVPQLNFQERKSFILTCKIFNLIGNDYVGHIVLQNKDYICNGKNIFDQTIITQIEKSSPELQKSGLIASYLISKSFVNTIVAPFIFRTLNEENQRMLFMLLNLGANPNEYITAHYATSLFCILDNKDSNFEEISEISWKLIKAGTDPRIVNLYKKDAFESSDWRYCKNEALHKKMKELKEQIFDYIKISGLDQKPIPKLPQDCIDKYHEQMRLTHP